MAYQVEWIPTAAIEALADKRGRPSRDESPLDYCEADDASETSVVGTFAEAVELAKSKIGLDYFGEVRIDRLVKIESWYMCDRWDSDAVWHVSERSDTLDEDSPDYRQDIDLIDDERVVEDS